MPSTNDFQPFRSDQKRAPFVIVVFASMSTIALTFVCLRAVWHVTSPLFTRNSRHTQSKAYAFFNTQLGHYAACLLASNLCTSIAGTITGNWVAGGGVQQGTICTTQAFLIQVGNWATAYFTGAMAIHTCRSLVFHSAQNSWVAYAVIFVGWLSAIGVGVAPLKMAGSWNGSTYGFDGFSCGIKRVYPVPEFVFYLLPIFVATIVTVVVYSLIYLVLRGTLVIMGGFKLNLDPHQRWSRHDAFEEYHRFIRAIARSMLWFPVAYVFLLLPYSVTKLLDLSGYSVAFGTNVFAETFTVMLGLVNVCILHNTFRVLEPVFEACSSASSPSFRDADIESPVEKTTTFDHPPVAPARSWSVRKPVASYQPTSWTHQKSVFDTGSDSLLIPGNGEFGGHASSSLSLGTFDTESIGRPITPASELDSAYIAAGPDAILQKRVVDYRLPYDHSRTFNTHSREVSESSISSFGVKARPALAKAQLVPSSYSWRRSRSPLPPQKPLISSNPPPLSLVVIPPRLSSSPPTHLRRLPQVPSNIASGDFGSASTSVAVDVLDGFPNWFRNSTDIVTQELISPAWTTLVIDTTTSNGASSVQRYTPSASANFTVDLTNRQQDSMGSVASRDIDVQLQQGLSKKPALTGGPSTFSNRDLSSRATNHYI